MSKYRRTWAEVPLPRRTVNLKAAGVATLGYDKLPPERECPECFERGGRHASWCGVRAKERRGQ